MKKNTKTKTDKLYDVIIVGAGLSGLSAAFQLKKKGYSILLLEENSHAGGKIQTLEEKNTISELGPDTFLRKSPQLMRLIQALQIDHKMIASQELARKRYIYIKQKLIHLPIGMKEFFFSPFLSPIGKIRLALEALQKSPKKKDYSSLTVADFFGQRMGKQAVTNLFDPFVSGIYAGNVNKLGAIDNFRGLVKAQKRYNSLFKFMKKAMKKKMERIKQGHKPVSGMYTFPRGLQELIDAQKQELQHNIQFQSSVHQIKQLERSKQYPKNHWQISYQKPDNSIGQIHGKAIILATPSYTAGKLIKPLNQTVSQNLESIVYPPLATGTVYFDSKDISHNMDGFGYLIPRSQHIELLGAIWHGSLFPAHVPQQYKAFRFYIGGDTNSQIAQKSETEIVAQVVSDIQKTMNITANKKPVFYQYHLEKKAIPQYYKGHSKKIESIVKELDNIPGIFLAGNYLKGVSLNDCVEQSNRTCYQVIKYLQT